MSKGSIFIYYGEGKGKTTLAIGQGIRAVGEGLGVIMIQFLDYNNTKEGTPLKMLEPDFRVFRFEKIRESIADIDENTKKDISSEIRNAFNFTRKIIETGECDVLILDGIIDAVENGYIDIEDLYEIISRKKSYMDIIATGNTVSDSLKEKSDYVYKICKEKTPSGV